MRTFLIILQRFHDHFQKIFQKFSRGHKKIQRLTKIAKDYPKLWSYTNRFKNSDFFTTQYTTKVFVMKQTKGFQNMDTV